MVNPNITPENEYLWRQIPVDIRKRIYFFSITHEEYCKRRSFQSLADLIDYSMHWDISEEGHSFWDNIHAALLSEHENPWAISTTTVPVPDIEDPIEVYERNNYKIQVNRPKSW